MIVFSSPPTSSTRTSPAPADRGRTSTSVQAADPAGGRTGPSSNSPRPPSMLASAAGSTRTGFHASADRWITPRCHQKTGRSTTPPSSAVRSSARTGADAPPVRCWLIDHCGSRARRMAGGPD